MNSYAPLVFIGFFFYVAFWILILHFVPVWLFIVLFACVNTAPSIIYYKHHKKKAEEELRKHLED